MVACALKILVTAVKDVPAFVAAESPKGERRRCEIEPDVIFEYEEVPAADPAAKRRQMALKAPARPDRLEFARVLRPVAKQELRRPATDTGIKAA
jgi:hypothetical protein